MVEHFRAIAAVGIVLVAMAAGAVPAWPQDDGADASSVEWVEAVDPDAPADGDGVDAPARGGGRSDDAEAADVRPANGSDESGAGRPPTPVTVLPREVQPIREVDPDDPYRERPADDEPVGPLLVREGKTLVDRTGRLDREGVREVFEFAGDAPPMVLQPCRHLERMEDLSDFGRRPMRFAVTGVVTEYRGQNYLRLLDSPRLVQDEKADDATVPDDGTGADRPDASDESAPESAQDDAGRDTVPRATDMAIPEERSLPEPRPSTPDRRLPTGSDHSTRAGLIREGKLLVDREGRITRKGNRTLFVFDSGDEPIVLLPNRKLELMEDMADYGRRHMRFRISGVVTAYRGRNYLSMTKMVVIPTTIENL